MKPPQKNGPHPFQRGPTGTLLLVSPCGETWVEINFALWPSLRRNKRSEGPQRDAETYCQVEAESSPPGGGLVGWGKRC